VFYEPFFIDAYRSATFSVFSAFAVFFDARRLASRNSITQYSCHASAPRYAVSPEMNVPLKRSISSFPSLFL
jgi:hypothetical protein